MKFIHGPDLMRMLEALAPRIGTSAGQTALLLIAHPKVKSSPGNVVDGEKWLGVGSKLNLRRGFPGTPEALDDQGWFVAGYTRRGDSRWTGYVLCKVDSGGLRTNTLPNCEAIDLVEDFQVAT